MTLVADRDMRQQIAQRVQEALDRHQPRKYRVAVNVDAIMKEDNWYHVVVESENDARDRDFYDSLAEAEAELNDDDDDDDEKKPQFLLVPAFAD